MNPRARTSRAMAGIAVALALVVWQAPTAEAGKRSLCGVAGCALPQPKISRSRLLAVFASSFWQDYRMNYCDANIHRFLKRLRRAGANLRAFEVLFLVPARWTQGQLTVHKNGTIAPSQERKPQAVWRYHVLLKMGSEILDLDFRTKPTAVKQGKYFKTMWDAANRQRMGVRRIPAADYLREYKNTPSSPTGLQKGYAYYAYDQGRRYKLLTPHALLAAP